MKRGETRRRFDPLNHHPAIREKLRRLEERPTESLGALTDLCYRYPTFYGFEYQTSGIPVLKGENITRDGEIKDVAEPDFISKEIDVRFPRTRLKKDDLIVSVRGEVGKVGLVPERYSGANINANTIRIALNDSAKGRDFEPAFIWEYLNSSTGQAMIQQYVAGGVQETITAPELLQVRIPKIGIDQQRQFILTLKEVRAERQAKLAKADALLAGMDEFLFKALRLSSPAPNLRRVFAIHTGQPRVQGRLNPDYYHPERVRVLRALDAASASMRIAPLSEVVTFERNQIKAQTENYLGLANVQSRTGELRDATEDAAGTCFTYQTDDVLFARLRPYLNKVYRAEMGGCCSPEFHVLRVKQPTEVLPDYLAAVLRSKLVLAQTIHMMTGNTHPRLANDDVVTLRIPIPKPAVQEAVADEVHHRRADARRLRAEAEAGWEQAKRWFEEQLLGFAAP